MADGIWQIEQSCPQCGGPVTLAETDRLLNCPYCRTRLYLVPTDHFHYYLPPPAGGAAPIYIPYWRLRGASFAVTDQEISHRFVDASALALGLSGLPPSLGLRPQALKLRFVTPTTVGKFLRPDHPASASLTATDSPDPGVFYRDYIGESVSVIHAPLFLRGDTLVDALLDRELPPCTAEEIQALLGAPEAERGPVRFVPTLCPHCNWDLEGQKDSLVLICRNCQSAWACPSQSFEPVDLAVLATPPGAGDATIHLPFWRMRPRFLGLELASPADLIRLANLPRQVTPALTASPLYFWSPAFKVNPALFSRWARQMTVFQPAGDRDDRLPASALYPVTLPLSEATAGIMITLAQLMMDKRRLYPRLPEVRVTVEEACLEYHPFISRQRELLHPALQVTLNPTALAYGIQM